MGKVLQMLEDASEQESNGFVYKALGPRGSVVFKLLLKSTLPNCLAFLTWLGLGLSTAVEEPSSGPGCVLLEGTVAMLVIAGGFGMFQNLKNAGARYRPETSKHSGK